MYFIYTADIYTGNLINLFRNGHNTAKSVKIHTAISKTRRECTVEIHIRVRLTNLSSRFRLSGDGDDVTRHIGAASTVFGRLEFLSMEGTWLWRQAFHESCCIGLYSCRRET